MIPIKTKVMKPTYLLTTKEEILERLNYLESNWSDKLRPEMHILNLLSTKYFGVPANHLLNTK